MTNWRKVAVWTGGAVLLLALAAAVALHALVDPERLKEIARDKAQAAWGRDLTIGDVSLGLWPVPSLHAENIALSNPEWAQEPHLVRADSLHARLELLPLLIGKARLKSLELEGVTAEIETSPQGDSNVPAGAKDSTPASTSELLNLTDVRIRDADIYVRGKDVPPVLWHIDEATLAASDGLRDVRVDAGLARNRFPLKVKAQLADLSRIGAAGATTDGKVDLDWGKTQMAAAGKFPIGADRRGYALTADIKSEGLRDLFDFLGTERHPRAGGLAHLEIRDADGVTDIAKLDITPGKLRVTGQAQVALSSPKITFSARLESDRLDWAATMLDAGGPVIPPLGEEELFHDTPLPWPLLVAMEGTQGKADVLVRSMKLRNGMELRNFKTQIAFDGDRMLLKPFATETLGGTATGTLLYQGRDKSVKAEFAGTNLLLQRWFDERGSEIPFTGGPMRVIAKFSSSGDSMKALAANATGPVTIRMGPAVWASKKAGDAEALMTNAFAKKDAGQIEFECVVATLPFDNGVAVADSILGFRTTASALTTSGKIDLREATIDVRGRLKPKSGVAIGLASIAGNVVIAGRLRHPKMTLDPLATPATVARAAAAVATLGLSALATTAADAADAKKNDPCA